MTADRYSSELVIPRPGTRALARILVVAALVGAVLVLAPRPAAAVTIDVTTTTDAVDPTDGVISLREAFAVADGNASDDEIVLEANAQYDLTDCAVGELQHTQPESLTITGNGATINQTCGDERVIHNSGMGSALTLSSVTLTSGFNSAVNINGAGILTNGLLTITDSTLTSLDAGSGTIIDGDDQHLTDLVLTNVTMSDNVGRGIRLSFGSLQMTGSTITDHTGDGIGLIDGLPVTITSSTISDNGGRGVSTTGQGPGTATLTDVTISGNGDTGFTCSGCDNITVAASMIVNNGTNPSSSGGGGVVIRYDQDEPDDAPVTSISDSTIDGNVANHPGAGIALEILDSSEPTAPQGQLDISNSNITNNETSDTGVFHGGGIATETGDLTLDGSTVEMNTSATGRGGGISTEELGVITEPPEVTITSSSITGNEAGLSGAGVATSDAIVLIDMTTIDGNTATTGGGGIAFAASAFPTSASLTVLNSTIANNAAAGPPGLGGGVLVTLPGGGLTAEVANSTITNNTASSSGGGIFVLDESDLHLAHVTLVDNASPDGANLFHTAGTLELTTSVIATPGGGGANCSLGPQTTASPGGHSYATDASCALGPDDTVDPADPLLGPLGDNGGPTATRSPDPTGPIAGLVPVAACVLGTDQRGVSRPQGANCEPGAVEVVEANMIMGTSGNDVLFGTPGDDIIRAGSGNDVVIGGGGNDTILGEDGNDVVFGDDGNDHIDGGAGADLLLGGMGDDDLSGGPGPDVLLGGPGNDVLDGDPNRDRCFPFGPLGGC